MMEQPVDVVRGAPTMFEIVAWMAIFYAYGCMVRGALTWAIRRRCRTADDVAAALPIFFMIGMLAPIIPRQIQTLVMYHAPLREGGAPYVWAFMSACAAAPAFREISLIYRRKDDNARPE